MKRKFTLAAMMTISMFVGMAKASVTDDFESGSFSADWETTNIATIQSETGNMYAYVTGAAANGDVLGGYFGTNSTDVAPDFTLSFDFRFTDTGQRQMCTQVGNSTMAVNNYSGGFINLAYDGTGTENRFEAFDGAAWVTLTGLPTNLADDTWHSVNITGRGFGTATPSYDITVNGVTQTNLTVFHSVSVATTSKASAFNFNDRYGSNPGFDVDNVSAFLIQEPIPPYLGSSGTPTGDLYTNIPPVISGTVIDGSAEVETMVLYIDGIDYVTDNSFAGGSTTNTITIPFSVSLDDGVHTGMVVAVDTTLAYTNTYEWTFQILPFRNASGTPSSFALTNALVVTATCIDGTKEVGAMELFVDGTSYAWDDTFAGGSTTNSISTSYLDLAAGVHTGMVTVVDTTLAVTNSYTWTFQVVLGKQPSLNDDFESGFSSDWVRTNGVTVLSETDNQYARVNSGANQTGNLLGGYLGSAGQKFEAFRISFDFRFVDTGVRQMNVMVGGPGNATATNSDPAINLIYDGVDNCFKVYNGTVWVTLTGLPTDLADNTWHSVTIDGYGFLSSGKGAYDVTVNGTTQTGITVFYRSWDNANIGEFNFNSAYGANPGFDVDNVVVFGVRTTTVYQTIPNIQSIETSGGMVSLTWYSEPSVSYNVRGRSSLVSGSWAVVTNGIPSGGASTSVSVPGDAAVQFYSITGE